MIEHKALRLVEGLRLELGLAEHLLHRIELIASDDIDRSDDAETFMRCKNEITALARSVARTLRDAETGLDAIYDAVEAPVSTPVQGVQHAA